MGSMKKISSELLHLALILTYLRGNQFPINHFENDIQDHVLGSSWGYTGTLFRHDLLPYRTKSMLSMDFDSRFGLDDYGSDVSFEEELGRTEDDLLGPYHGLVELSPRLPSSVMVNVLAYHLDTMSLGGIVNPTRETSSQEAIRTDLTISDEAIAEILETDEAMLESILEIEDDRDDAYLSNTSGGFETEDEKDEQARFRKSGSPSTSATRTNVTITDPISKQNSLGLQDSLMSEDDYEFDFINDADDELEALQEDLKEELMELELELQLGENDDESERQLLDFLSGTADTNFDIFEENPSVRKPVAETSEDEKQIEEPDQGFRSTVDEDLVPFAGDLPFGIDSFDVVAPSSGVYEDSFLTCISPMQIHSAEDGDGARNSVGAKEQGKDDRRRNEGKCDKEVAGSSTGCSSKSPSSNCGVEDGRSTDVNPFMGCSTTAVESSQKNVLDWVNDINNNPSCSQTSKPGSAWSSGGLKDSTGHESSLEDEMIQATSFSGSRAAAQHSAPHRGFQVHARMPGLLRGGSMDHRWQELASLLSFQAPHHESNGSSLPPTLSHAAHFASHHHHHHHHPQYHPHPGLPHGPPLHPHAMHPPSFASTGPPTGAYSADSARSVLFQNTTLGPSDLNNSSGYPAVGMGGSANLGSAVASSMHLTNSSDPMGDPSSHYKLLDNSHDMMYYTNGTVQPETNNQSNEGLLTSFLNEDEDLLMDMAMNEGMYTMRPLDNNSTGAPVHPHSVHSSGAQSLTHPNVSCGLGTTSDDRIEAASSDSAVSSMGSERAAHMPEASIADGDWAEPDNQSMASHDSASYSEYPKLTTSVAQKKHHLFGKRYPQDHGSSHPFHVPHQSSLHMPYTSGAGLHINGATSLEPLEFKYSYGMDFGRSHGAAGCLASEGLQHNHTYSLPPHAENMSAVAKPLKHSSKEKSKKENLSRDEKRAIAMNLPITCDDIIHLPMDEFNERLSKFDLSEPQLSLIRDIRRRGKNKVAAQNCRKRKLDQIVQLADEVKQIRDRKMALMRERQELSARRHQLKEKYTHLYRTVFQSLRDPDGNPYSPYDYSLQQAADGNVIIVPKNGNPGPSDTSNPSNSSRRDKTKDDNSRDPQS